MKNLKLKLIRKKIDKLDDKLLNLIKIRTNLVTEILTQKRYKNQIIDKARIKEVLTLIKRKSISRKNLRTFCSFEKTQLERLKTIF